MASPPYAFHAVTDVGRQREQNEDACGDLATSGGTLLIVCDGMGGHEAGEVASRLAVDAIGQIFTNSPADDPAERLKSGFLVANQRILAHAEKLGLDSMGTTAVAAFVRDGEAWIAHVGDSRVYHLRGGAVLWRTADHTRVQKMVERGILTAEQAKSHDDANVVTRALGFAKGEEQPEPDVASGRALRDGDVLVLCSDGLHDLVPDDEIAAVGSDNPPALAAQALVDLANQRGGHDNITVSVLRWGEAATLAKGSLTPAVRKRRTALDDDDARAAPAPAPAPVAQPAARPAAATPDDRPRRALILVIAGVALVGIAAAVFLITAGGDDSGGGTPTPPRPIDAGAGVAPIVDGGAAAATGDGSALPPLPDWDPSVPDGGARRPPPGRKDAGAPAPRTDAGAAATTAIDAGAGSTNPPVDAGAGKPPVDAGALRPITDAGVGRTRDGGTGGSVGGPSKADAGVPKAPATDAGVPKPPKPSAVDAGAPPKPKPAADGGTK